MNLPPPGCSLPRRLPMICKGGDSNTLKLKRAHTSFLRLILAPVHFSESPSNFNGILGKLNSIPSPINSNRNHIKSNRKPRNFEKEPH